MGVREAGLIRGAGLVAESSVSSVHVPLQLIWPPQLLFGILSLVFQEQRFCGLFPNLSVSIPSLVFRDQPKPFRSSLFAAFVLLSVEE